MSNITIKTNHQPRPCFPFNEVPKEIREKEFSYHRNPFYVGCFFKYKGHYYDASEFTHLDPMKGASPFNGWDGILNQGFFSGLLLKWGKNPDYVTIGEYSS